MGCQLSQSDTFIDKVCKESDKYAKSSNGYKEERFCGDGSDLWNEHCG
jgi:hypothetical protein